MTAPATNEPQYDEPVRRNKAYFFAVWDRALCTAQGVTTDSARTFPVFQRGCGGIHGHRGSGRPWRTSSKFLHRCGEAGRAGIFRYYNAWVSGSHSFVTNERPLAGESKKVTVEAQQPPAEISLTLTRAGVISGRVRDADGRLLVHAPIRIVGLPAPVRNRRWTHCRHCHHERSGRVSRVLAAARGIPCGCFGPCRTVLLGDVVSARRQCRRGQQCHGARR